MICRNCGFDNNEQSQFCVNCGTVLEQPQQNYQQPQNQPYNQPYNAYTPYQSQPVNTPGKGFAIAAMILGIISFFCVPIVTGALGIIFGGVAKSKGYRGGMATAGIVCGILGIVGWILMLAVWGDIYTQMLGGRYY